MTRRVRKPRPNPAYIPRVNNGGNYCGHNPANPQRSLAEPLPEKFPYVLAELMRRLADYLDNPQKIPTLNRLPWSRRRHRSEGREACLLVMLAILRYTDLVTLTVGVPTEGGLGTMSIDTLAKKAGLSVSRAARAVARWQAAGVLTVKRLPPDAEGAPSTLPAIKAVSAKLWGMFGLLRKLGEVRPIISAKIAREGRKLSRKIMGVRAKARTGLALDVMKKMLPQVHQSAHDVERQRQIAAREIDLMQQHPDWPPDKIRRVARQARA